MKALAIALALVVSMYSLFWWGQARGATDMLILAREKQGAIIADYADALAHAQLEYDELRRASDATNAHLENALEIERDTREWWRAEADQKSAEANRWQSLANVLRGTAY